MDVVLLGLPHKVTAQKVPEIAALPSVKVVDMSGDFRLKDAAAYERYYGQPHPHPELLADFVYGLPELNRERIRARPLRRLARLLRHHHRARAPAAGPGRAARGRGPRPGHHRQLRLGRGPAGRHPPPGPRRQPARLQAARAPARPGDRGDPGVGRGARPRSSASCRSRRRWCAGSSPPPSSSCPRSGPASGSPRSTATPSRASRSCGCRRGGCPRWRPSPAPTSPRWAWRPGRPGAAGAR